MAIPSSGHQMASWSKVTVDHRLRRQEPLRLFGLFEALHLPLSSPGWPMRVLGSIIQIPAGPMADIGKHRSIDDTIAAETIGDEASRFVSQSL
jgi:hypothetical protein